MLTWVGSSTASCMWSSALKGGVVAAYFFIVLDSTFLRISICFEHSFYGPDWCLVNPGLKARLLAAGTWGENILCEQRDEKEVSSFNSPARELPPLPVFPFFSYQNRRLLLVSDQILKHFMFKRSSLKWELYLHFS